MGKEGTSLPYSTSFNMYICIYYYWLCNFNSITIYMVLLFRLLKTYTNICLFGIVGILILAFYYLDCNIYFL